MDGAEHAAEGRKNNKVTTVVVIVGGDVVVQRQGGEWRGGFENLLKGRALNVEWR